MFPRASFGTRAVGQARNQGGAFGAFAPRNFQNTA